MKIRGNTVGTPIKPEKNLVKATNLTEGEKAQARENIGAVSNEDFRNHISTADGMFYKSKNLFIPDRVGDYPASVTNGLITWENHASYITSRSIRVADNEQFTVSCDGVAVSTVKPLYYLADGVTPVLVQSFDKNTFVVPANKNIAYMRVSVEVSGTATPKSKVQIERGEAITKYIPFGKILLSPDVTIEELQDLRTGFDGKTYASASDAVTTQIGELFDYASTLVDVRDRVEELVDATAGVVYSRNLLPNKFADGEFRFINGVIFRNELNGQVSATGSASGTASYCIVYNMTVKAGTYTFSTPASVKSGGKIRAQYWSVSDNTAITTKYLAPGGSTTISFPEDVILNLHIVYDSGYSITGTEWWSPMFEIGNTATAFTPGETVLDLMQDTVSEHTEQISNIHTEMGDIETALDGIIAIQNELIGGDEA